MGDSEDPYPNMPFLCKVWEAPSGLYRMTVLQQLCYLERTHTQDGGGGVAGLLSRGPPAGWDFQIFHFPSPFGLPNIFY